MGVEEKRTPPGMSTEFPVPDDGRNFTCFPASNLVTFQTELEMHSVAEYYRREFAGWNFRERVDLNTERIDFIRLVFEHRKDGSMVVVQIMNLKYTLHINLRYVHIFQEERRIR